jgi:signal peptidase I
MREWLATVSIEYVIATAAVLLIVRLILGRYKSHTAIVTAEFVESAVIAIVLVYLVIRPFVVQVFYIPTGSMLPTLGIGDEIVVNDFIYRFREPQYGEIMVFRSPREANSDGIERNFIKRVVGRPGDTIEIKDGAVYRNDKRLNEPYLDGLYIEYEMDPVKIPQGKLFMMGDNRNNSKDSHMWGPLDRSRVIGKAMVRFWPINRLGLLH